MGIARAEVPSGWHPEAILSSGNLKANWWCRLHLIRGSSSDFRVLRTRTHTQVRLAPFYWCARFQFVRRRRPPSEGGGLWTGWVFTQTANTVSLCYAGAETSTGAFTRACCIAVQALEAEAAAGIHFFDFQGQA